MEKKVKISKKYNIKWNLDLPNIIIKEKITTEFEITKITTYNEKHKKNIKIKEKIIGEPKKEIVKIPIRKVSISEITALRECGKPGFLLKKGDELFYAEIKKHGDIECLFVMPHKCADHCKHLSAASDENGGCAKIRNKDTFIERYPWIRLGYETFNTKNDVFVIAICNHHEHTGRYDDKKGRRERIE